MNQAVLHDQPSFAQAQEEGSRILMEEAQRAQEVQRLQYQAELLKQRAEITRYINQIKENGGDVSDLDLPGGFPSSTHPQQTKSSPAAAAPATKISGELPTLVGIEKDKATFETGNGRVSGRIGQTLPGGYRIVSLDMRDGVRLQKDGMKYDIDIAW